MRRVRPGPRQKPAHEHVCGPPPQRAAQGTAARLKGTHKITNSTQDQRQSPISPEVVTLYKDLDQNGFHGENQLKKPNRLWIHATILGAGDYPDNRYPDDFLVRWSDGEVSMYPDTDATGLNREITLVYPPG
ncbi:hypothetical protein GCM10012285_24880 [Streptomyces kronopolitis]|uniref:Uncharacterized protein n=1 Tax=Streptomyces kronopolitis TaxID=1612435 RepID=A0ABQ2JE46_9ACTN|nr:hypothetical protein GCM10012285_24880 [Streptomyces kronopolitis]